MDGLRIREAQPNDTEAISSLAIRSKAHWGYTPEQMATFRGELTMTSEILATRTVFVAEVNTDAETDTEIVGYYSLNIHGPHKVELEHLFVAPTLLGYGMGTHLYEDARRVAQEVGAITMVIQSDPNAKGFYVKMGARLVKEIPSSIPGRTIPLFEANLSEDRLC